MTTPDNSIVDEFTFDDDMDISNDSNSDNISNEEKVRKLISKNLKTCSLDKLEEDILTVACPVLKEILIDAVNEIEKVLIDGNSSKDPRIFDDRFVKCQSALEPWKEIMNHVQNYGKSCEFTILKSLIDNFPNVVIKICGHCKTNRQRYHKDKLPPLLSDVFKETCGIVKTFCNLLNSKIKFSPESEFEALKKLISEIGEIGRLITYDLVAMVQTWKTFAKLSITHREILISNNSTDDIMHHFKFLGTIINSLNSNILKSPLEIFEKRAKCTNLLLAILDRLHSVFCSHQLKPEFLREMLPVLIESTANHVMCTGAKLSDHERDLYKARAKIITSNLPQSIVNYYTESHDFWIILLDEFAEVKKRNQLKYTIGYHLIILSSIEKWRSADLFFGIAIENVQYLQEEILIGSLDFPGIKDKVGSIYDSTLSVLSDFLIKKVDEFEIYETVIMRNLFKESLWPLLMSHDILHQCYKVSSQELPLTHIEHFMKAYELLKNRGDSLVVVMLSRLIIDIYSLLSIESREKILKNYHRQGSLLLILKNGSNDESIQCKALSLYRKITGIESVSTLPQVIADLRQEPTVKNWNRIVELLEFIGVVKEKTNRTNTDKLCEFSSSIINALGECIGWRRKMLLDVITLLFDCAEIDAEDCSYNWSLISVLITGVTRTSDLPPEFLIKMCHYLTKNVQRFSSTSEENIPIISHLFCFLLEHRNDFIRQEALEAFDYIVEHCENVNFVTKITKLIAQRPKLRKIVPAYLKKEILEEIPSITEHLRVFCKRRSDSSLKHKCHDEEEEEEEKGEEEEEEEEVEEPAPKRSKSSSDDLVEKAEIVCDNLRVLSDEKRSLNSATIRKLSVVCRSFLGEY